MGYKEQDDPHNQIDTDRGSEATVSEDDDEAEAPLKKPKKATVALGRVPKQCKTIIDSLKQEDPVRALTYEFRRAVAPYQPILDIAAALSRETQEFLKPFVISLPSR